MHTSFLQLLPHLSMLNTRTGFSRAYFLNNTINNYLTTHRLVDSVLNGDLSYPDSEFIINYKKTYMTTSS